MFPSSDIYEFWPPNGRKFRFGLPDRRATGTYDRSLRGGGVGHQIQNFQIFSRRVYFPRELEGRGSEYLPPVKFTNFGRPLPKNFDSVFLTKLRPGEANFANVQVEIVFSFGTWRLGSRIFPPSLIYEFLPPAGQKIRFGRFDRPATRTPDRDLRRNSNFIFFWRDNFAPEFDASVLEIMPPENFAHLFGPPVKNYDSVVLTVVRPDPWIAIWGATKWVKF